MDDLRITGKPERIVDDFDGAHRGVRLEVPRMRRAGPTGSGLG